MDFIDLNTQYKALREGINARIQRVLDHGQYNMGPEVKELEDRLAAWNGAKHCVAVASGTEALLRSALRVKSSACRCMRIWMKAPSSGSSPRCVTWHPPAAKVSSKINTFPLV